MTEFLTTLITLCVVCSAALLIAPDGSFKKYVTLCCSLCAVAFVAASVSFAFPGGFELPEAVIEDKTGELQRLQAEQTVKNIEAAVIAAAQNKYNIMPSCIKVKVASDMSDLQNVKLSGIYITLTGLENAVKVTRLKTYIAREFDCYTEVSFEEDG